MERNNSNKEKETLALAEAQKFVKENIVEAVNGRVCVDGRYDPNGEQKGLLARAGGDFGYVMGLLALSKQGKINLTPEEAVDTVYNFVTQDDGKFFMHTDQHSVDEKTPSGCGHTRLASNPDYADRFGVSATDMMTALSYIRNKKQHPNVEEVVLQGDHEEKGTIIVRGLRKTLNHKDANSQYFIYDKDRDDEVVEQFIGETNVLDLDLEAFKQILDMQTTATLQLLAPEWPIFEADLTGEEAKVTLLPTNSQD